MILEKAYYQQNFSVGQFLFSTYGLGALIEEGETHQEVYAQLKERVYAQFRADNPHLEEERFDAISSKPFLNAIQPMDARETSVYNLEQPTPPPKPESVEEQIKSCTDASTLEKTYKFLVKTNKSWLAAYEETMDRLTKNTTTK